MKKMTKVLAFLALVSIAVLAGRTFNNPVDAAVACPQVQNYLKAGFTLDEVSTSQVKYLIGPTGTYLWGSVTMQLHGRTGGPYSLETTYATVTCEVQVKEQADVTKYNVIGTEVVENIVY